MSAVKSVRKTRNSRKHLVTDFDWECLEDLTLPTADGLFHDLCEPQLDAMEAARLSAFSPPGEDTSLDSRPRTEDGKDLGKAVKTKQGLQESNKLWLSNTQVQMKVHMNQIQTQKLHNYNAI